MCAGQVHLFSSSTSIWRRRKLRYSYLSDGIVFERSLLGSLNDSKVIAIHVKSIENSLLQSELIDFYDQIAGNAQLETKVEQNDSDSTLHCLKLVH